MHLKLKLLRY